MPRLKPKPQPPAEVAAVAQAPAIRKALLSVEEFAEAVSLSRTTAFALIKEGKVQSVLVGKRRLVLATEPDAFALRLQQGGLN